MTRAQPDAEKEQRGAAIERERKRLAAVRARRALRDQARLQASLDEADRRQRLPLLLRLQVALHVRMRQSDKEERQLARQQRAEQAWVDLPLAPFVLASWRGAGFASPYVVQRTLADLYRATLDQADKIWRAYDIDEARRSVIDLLGVLPAFEGSLLAANLAGTPLLPVHPTEEHMVVELASCVPPSQLTPTRGLSGTRAWQDWAICAARQEGPTLAGADVDALDPRVLDDLVSRYPGQLLSLSAEAQSAPRARYIMARIDPAQLSEKDLSELGWAYEAVRRRMLAGAAKPNELAGVPFLEACATLSAGNADPAAMKVVHDAVPSALTADLVRFLERGPLTQAMVQDRTTWLLLEAAHRNRDVPSDDWATGFSVWRALRRVRQLLYQRDVSGGLAAARAAAVVCRGQTLAEVETARGLLHGLKGDAVRAQRAFSAAAKAGKNDVVMSNEAAARSAADVTRLSPFAVLGLDYGDAGWEHVATQRYRATWRTDPDLAAEVNWAQEALEREAGNGWVRFPVRVFHYELAGGGHGIFRPEASPFPRCYPPIDDAYEAELHQRAWQELLPRILTTQRTP